MSNTCSSKYLSVESSLGLFGTESKAQDCRHLPNLTNKLSGAPLCHTLPCTGSTSPQEPGDPQGPPTNPLCLEKAVTATWEQPWTLEVLRPETPSGATYSFQEVTEPAVMAVDRQAIFPDTWSLTEGHGQWKEQARPEAGRLGSNSPAPVNMDHLGREMSKRESLIRPTQGSETPRSVENTTEAATEARKERLELPHAMVMGTRNTTERISTSGQAGASLHGC
ncbi:uncharacterized protein LOC105886997 [Otolemur garnettii]|uniref:uncharacterized protein LOC105886997 n=1 Tax=Otolemur garnettii TaxID=30611 RepID=UPI000644221B|nr:uncharacterized protein LOC105886997 [Otolemur garnettii]